MSSWKAIQQDSSYTNASMHNYVLQVKLIYGTLLQCSIPVNFIECSLKKKKKKKEGKEHFLIQLSRKNLETAVSLKGIKNKTY